MRLLLAGRWPALKPLPVFKFETADYRASIDFDKTRGEWLCRKTSLPSYKVEELRGGLPEIIVALPDGQAEAFAECAAAGQQEQELDKDASRRLQALLEWRENYENGALYTGLQDYLSASQQHEVDEILRLTLTARQLQFSPKNVAYVFDALSKAGGKLATLMEIAQRDKTEQEADVPAIAEATAPGAECRAPVENFVPATRETFPEEPIGSVFPENDQSSSPELMAHTVSQTSKIATPELLDVNLPPLAEDLHENEHHQTAVAGIGPQVRKGKTQSSADRIENSPSRKHVLEISGFQVAAFASVFLCAVISLAVGLTVGRGPLGKRIRDAQKSILADDAASTALPNRPNEVTSQSSTPPEGAESRSARPSSQSLTDSDNSSGANKPGDTTTSKEKSRESTRELESFANVPSTNSNSSPTIESKPSVNPGPDPGRNGSVGGIARNTPQPATPKPAHPLKAVAPTSDASRNPAAPRAPATNVSPHLSPPSAILVTAPAHGSKPFRVTFREKPIAASSSIAMTSELSVLIPPQPGPAAAHKHARLQAGELVFFVWPRYSRPGNRDMSAETIRVRTTIGQLGQVQDIKLVSGSIALLPATINAISLWRYRPTLLNKKPVQVQQDVTIEFRPPQYLSQVRTQHPSHK